MLRVASRPRSPTFIGDGGLEVLDLHGIGERVRAIREKRGWSQLYVGTRMPSRKTDAWVSLVETGSMPNLSIAMLGELADALAVPVAQLLDDGDAAADSFDVSHIPGWEDLSNQDKNEVLSLVALRARLNRDARALESSRAGTDTAPDPSLHRIAERGGPYGDADNADREDPGREVRRRPGAGR